MNQFGCKVAVVEPGGFKTGIGANVFSLYERSWNQCSAEIKREYASRDAARKRNYMLCIIVYACSRFSLCPIHNVDATTLDSFGACRVGACKFGINDFFRVYCGYISLSPLTPILILYTAFYEVYPIIA